VGIHGVFWSRSSSISNPVSTTYVQKCRPFFQNSRKTFPIMNFAKIACAMKILEEGMHACIPSSKMKMKWTPWNPTIHFDQHLPPPAQAKKKIKNFWLTSQNFLKKIIPNSFYSIRFVFSKSTRVDAHVVVNSISKRLHTILRTRLKIKCTYLRVRLKFRSFVISLIYFNCTNYYKLLQSPQMLHTLD